MTEEIRALREEFAEFRAMLMTPDNFVRYERLPQLVGSGIEHEAGSEEVNAVADRWEYIAPAHPMPGEGANLIIAKTVNKVTVLDVTETGKLMSIGILTSFASNPYSTPPDIDLDLVITVDGDPTPQRIPLAVQGADFVADLLPWHRYSGGRDTVVDGPAFGGRTGDALSLDLPFEYRTSLKVELDCTESSNWTGAETWIVACYVHRARLV